ncbi:MAG: purine-nucleoside phosphorylase [bacterium]
MNKTVEFIQNQIKEHNFKPETAIILGSGLGDFAEKINGVRINFSDIPGFAASSVAGHAGKLIIGELFGKHVLAMQGRFHFYEGHSLEKVIYPIRIMKLLGIKNLIVTNAAGGVNTEYKPGDLMVINDHINFIGTNPLIGKNFDEFGPRFPDMSKAYADSLIELANKSGEKLGIKLQNGVYAALTGPSYETPAEIRMLRLLGADAVGMSTVPEVIAANHCGMNVLGISCITNMACGILDQPLNHEEVIETSNMAKASFIGLISEVIKNI